MTSAGTGIDGQVRLQDGPDWQYLLREFYDIYLRSSAGGSQRIRSHQRAVRETISRTIAANPLLKVGQPLTKPVCAHLKRALDQGRLQRTAPIIRAIESVSAELSWMYEAPDGKVCICRVRRTKRPGGVRGNHIGSGAVRTEVHLSRTQS